MSEVITKPPEEMAREAAKCIGSDAIDIHCYYPSVAEKIILDAIRAALAQRVSTKPLEEIAREVARQHYGDLPAHRNDRELLASAILAALRTAIAQQEQEHAKHPLRKQLALLRDDLGLTNRIAELEAKLAQHVEALEDAYARGTSPKWARKVEALLAARTIGEEVKRVFTPEIRAELGEVRPAAQEQPIAAKSQKSGREWIAAHMSKINPETDFDAEGNLIHPDFLAAQEQKESKQ